MLLCLYDTVRERETEKGQAGLVGKEFHFQNFDYGLQFEKRACDFWVG